MKAINDYNEYESKMIESKNDLDNSIKNNNDTLNKLEVEKNLLLSLNAIKEKEIQEMEFLVLKTLPGELVNLEYLLNKEIEINNKLKTENNYLLSKNEDITQDLQTMINYYKEIANIDLEKTKEGYLKIIFFRNINFKFPEGANLIVEIKNGLFKIISIFPHIKITAYEEELQVTQNFTLFLTKLANEFLKFMK